jgi:endonuclease/exonuclease/phosphatase family metal-dependent hydrolase
MAKKKAKENAPLSKPMLALVIILIVIGLVYYLWQNNGEFREAAGEITGIDAQQVTQPSDASSTPPPLTGNTTLPDESEAGRIRVYSFNIQIFGASKMKKTAVVQVLTDIISKVDVVAVQEVRATNDAPVKEFMALLPSKYNYVLGPREGRTASKEQYWVIYDSEKLEVMGDATYDDKADRFQRSPMAVYFQTKNDQFDFILVDNHIQPSDAAAEIGALPEVIAYFQAMWKETDVLVVGDFNADGSYYNEKNLSSVFPDSDYLIILTNEYDTTVAGDGDSTTYDRFIITKSAREDFTGNFGVIYFDKIYDFSSLGIEPKAVSDHFPIWAEFYTDRDTD